MSAGSDDGGDRAPVRRLFLALWPDDALRERIERTILPALPVRAGRAVPGENLHLTLVFLGDVPERQLGCVEDAAAGARAEPFELVLDRLSWWRQSQVLWLGARETPPALAALVGALRERLAACGLALESRPFRAHMTLLRKVRRRPSLPHGEPLHWRPDSHALIESTPVPGGVRYTRRASWPIG